MAHYFSPKTLEEKMALMAKSRYLVEEEINPKQFGLHEIKDAVEHWKTHASLGKIMIKPTIIGK